MEYTPALVCGEVHVHVLSCRCSTCSCLAHVDVLKQVTWLTTTTGRRPICNTHRCLSSLSLSLSLQVCVFCRNNGESEAVYSSHMLKDAEGKICCPVLYIYTCPICGASGPDAHTIKYCPQNHGGDSCNVKALKTSRTSAGRRRYFQQ